MFVHRDRDWCEKDQKSRLKSKRAPQVFLWPLGLGCRHVYNSLGMEEIDKVEYDKGMESLLFFLFSFVNYQKLTDERIQIRNVVLPFNNVC